LHAIFQICDSASPAASRSAKAGAVRVASRREGNRARQGCQNIGSGSILLPSKLRCIHLACFGDRQDACSTRSWWL